MKTIIRFITAERPGESDGKSGALILSEKHMEAVNDEYILAIEETNKNSWDKWMPDPYDANPSESSKRVLMIILYFQTKADYSGSLLTSSVCWL